MKRLSAIAAAFFCLFVLTQPLCAIPTSYTDLWDISQGSSVTVHSPVYSGGGGLMQPGMESDIRNMFGGNCGNYYGIPYEETDFTNEYGAGTIHWVEWQTPSSMTLRSFNLVALHDLPPYSINTRGFSQFRLQWADSSTGPWTLLYELTDTDPDGDLLYGGGPTYPEEHYLELAVNVAPTTAQYWRAEFVQYGESAEGTGINHPGTTIVELDGYNTFLPTVIPTVIPAPGALVLGSIGMGIVACLRRRRTL